MKSLKNSIQNQNNQLKKLIARNELNQVQLLKIQKLQKLRKFFENKIQKKYFSLFGNSRKKINLENVHYWKEQSLWLGLYNKIIHVINNEERG